MLAATDTGALIAPSSPQNAPCVRWAMWKAAEGTPHRSAAHSTCRHVPHNGGIALLEACNHASPPPNLPYTRLSGRHPEKLTHQNGRESIFLPEGRVTVMVRPQERHAARSDVPVFADLDAVPLNTTVFPLPRCIRTATLIINHRKETKAVVFLPQRRNTHGAPEKAPRNAHHR